MEISTTDFFEAVRSISKGDAASAKTITDYCIKYSESRYYHYL